MRKRRRPDVNDAPGSLLSDAALRRLTLREHRRNLEILAVGVRHILPGLLRKRTRTPKALAPRIRRAVIDLGPPFVKLSQLVSSSPGVFPAAVSEDLRDLLDSAPSEPWDEIRRVIETELGADIEALFASIDSEPMAAASIAQVHAVTLLDGTRAVVKVRRPGVEAKFLTDLRLLRIVARLLDRFSRHARVFNPKAIVDDVIELLRRELDFTIEADSMERFEKNLRSYGSHELVRVPAVFRDLTVPAVLTMERIDGTKVDDLPSLQATGFDLLERLQAGLRAWIEAACQHRFFHGDVHAGNILLDEEGRVVFLDFGIMGELDEATAQLVRRGVLALLYHHDFAEVTRCLAELGTHLGADITEDQAASAIRRLAEPLLDRPIQDIDYQEVLGAAVRKAAPHGVQLPRSLVLLAKQILYFERYGKIVAPEYPILADTSLIEFMIDESLHLEVPPG